MKPGSYVLITAARNEAAYIEKTMQSVINQTVLPEKWVIVSDGSTDQTDEIIKQYQLKNNWIEFYRREPQNNRNFGSKICALREGISRLNAVAYEWIGNLDADVSFESHYFEKLLEKFGQNPRLGIAGGAIIDRHHDKEYRHPANKESIGGAVQFFRRRCFEEIGGYLPLAYGQVDAVAEITARMKGWETRQFAELKVLHHRRIGTYGRSIWKVRFQEGRVEYLIGYHPLFHVARTIQRLGQKPYILGSAIRTCGYLWACLIRPRRDVSQELVKFGRQEEMQKLRSLFNVRPSNKLQLK